MVYEEQIELIKANIGEFVDFPTKGVVFRDIFTAIKSGPVCAAIRDLLINYVKKSCPDVEVFVGLESRGFLFCLMLAAEFGVGCVPIRKKGKLPGKCETFDYTLEYGKDTIEIQLDSIKPGQKVVILDDLIASGGTLSAAIELIEKIGGHILESIVLMELESLNGRARVKNKIHSFITYN